MVFVAKAEMRQREEEYASTGVGVFDTQQEADKRRGLPLAVRIFPFSLLRLWRSGAP